jgi:DNA-binding CsgD family transcriptional regulator
MSAPPDVHPMLTRHQGLVLDLLCAGKTYAEIGALLGIAESTAKDHLRHICDRLGVANKYAAAYKWATLRPAWERACQADIIARRPERRTVPRRTAPLPRHAPCPRCGQRMSWRSLRCRACFRADLQAGRAPLFAPTTPR